MDIGSYIALLDNFVEHRLPVDEFERRYLEAYKAESDITDETVQDELWRLFTDVDAYSPMCKPGQETPLVISEQRLRSQARAALEKLRRLASLGGK